MGKVAVAAVGIILIFMVIGVSMFSASSIGGLGSGSGSGFDRRGESDIQIEGLNLYNSDGSVNRDKIKELDDILTKNYLNTVHHTKNYEKQNGPFYEYWGENRDNSLNKFQCTWWADGRADQFLAVCLGKEREDWFKSRGNGVDVVGNAKNNGWEYGTTPQMNSVISFKSDNIYGHVAYVEAVDKVTKEIYISHAGGGRSWFGIQKLSPNSDGTYSCPGKSVGFIYLDDGSTTTSNNSGGQYDRLINARNPLAKGEEPTDLVTIYGSLKACSAVVNSYNSMVQAAKNAGVNISVCSAYRTYESQESKFNNRTDKNLNAISYYQSPLTSEHRTRTSYRSRYSCFWKYRKLGKPLE